MLQGFKDDFITLRKMFWPNEQDKAERAAAIAREEEERRKFDEEWNASTKRIEESHRRGRSLGWATHRVRLTQDYWWYHMLASCIPAGTEGRARMLNGKWEVFIDDGENTGFWTFTDDEVEIIEHLNEVVS